MDEFSLINGDLISQTIKQEDFDIFFDNDISSANHVYGSSDCQFYSQQQQILPTSHGYELAMTDEDYYKYFDCQDLYFPNNDTSCYDISDLLAFNKNNDCSIDRKVELNCSATKEEFSDCEENEDKKNFVITKQQQTNYVKQENEFSITPAAIISKVKEESDNLNYKTKHISPAKNIIPTSHVKVENEIKCNLSIDNETKSNEFSSISNCIFKTHSKYSKAFCHLFKCDICGKLNKSIEDHRLHASNHVILLCDYPNCSFSAAHITSINQHKAIVHTRSKQTSFLCPFNTCKAVFKSTSSLNTHVSAHLKPYFCRWPKCNYASSKFDHVLSHIAGFHFKQYFVRPLTKNSKFSKFIGKLNPKV